MNKKRKISIKKILKFVIIIIIILLLIFVIIKNILNGKSIENKLKTIQEKVNITAIKNSKNIKIINNNESTDNTNNYWDYIKNDLISVDLNKIKDENKDIIGWLQIMGTNIDYPFVQTNNNEYYLTHLFDKSKSDIGWIFLDYKNNIESLDKHTIIYINGNTENDIFNTLKNIITNGWLNNPDNFIIKTSTESQNNLWQIFSLYRINTSLDCYNISFSTNDEFKNFSEKLINRSVYDFNTKIDPSDKILTISINYDETDKILLHAKLIKSHNEDQQ